MNNSINNIILGSYLLGGFITTLPQLQASLPSLEQQPQVRRPSFQRNCNLHDAALNGDIERVRELLEQGDDPNEKNIKGQTPLHLAAYMERLNLIPILIDAGADINAKDDFGKTPLHSAAEWNDDASTTELLIQNRADVNAKDSSGKTPLYYTIAYYTIAYKAKNNRLKMIKILLENGADPNIPDDQNVIPLQWAEKYLQFFINKDSQAGRSTASKNAVLWTEICDLLK
jgi:ankyrin repeat protein